MSPYYVSDTAEGCDGWATVKEDGEVMGCHTVKQDAIDQALAIALSEGSTFEGERAEDRELPDNYRPATSDDVPEGRACGNCIFFNEDDVAPDGRARCTRWDEYVDGGFYCNQWEGREEARPYDDEDDEEDRELRQVDLSPPAYMRASARRGLVWHEAGLSGDGLLPATVREARAMSNGSMTADKWVRTRAFIARHLVDMDAPANTPGDDNYPGPGAVAMALWGGGGSKRSAERALAYAEGVVARIEAENEGRAKGQALSKMETRTNPAQFEVRETEEGMVFSGYAAVFNSDSVPLPFTERIAPGAFRGSLRNRNDIKLLWNHDSGQPLASTRAGNLRLTEDDRGLFVEATLPQTSVGRDASVLIRDNIVDSMSFGFTVARNGEEWSEDGQVRTLTKISLHEVSIVSFPAYPGTAGSTAVRGLDKVAKRAEVDADELADALLKIENGEDITTADRNIISTVLDKISPVEEEPAQPKGDLEMLALKKKKLDLLMKGI
jgi:HK97 family phage prohead protease